MNCFGDRMKKLRLDKNLSQEQLAVECGTSAIFIRHIEKSRRFPNYELLISLCNKLEVSPEYLLQDELTFNLCSDDKSEVLAFINKLTPKQMSMLKDLLNSSRKYLVDDDSI